MATTTTAAKPQPNYQAIYDSYYNPIADQVNKYSDELINQAQGDYDFAAKYLENAYKEALGNNDAERAQFLKSVANDLEQKVGTIAFDYQTGTYRANRDAQTQTTRLQQDTSRQLQRLQEDEQVAKQQQAQQNKQDRMNQDASLNSRGIVSAPRDQAQGLQGMEVGNLEQQIADKQASLERSVGRNRQDILTNQERGLSDITTNLGDTTQDLTTGARRAAFGAQTSYDQGLGNASRQLTLAKQQAEAQRRSGLNQAKSYADYFAKPLVK